MNRCLSDSTILSSLQFIGILYHPHDTLLLSWSNKAASAHSCCQTQLFNPHSVHPKHTNSFTHTACRNACWHASKHVLCCPREGLVIEQFQSSLYPPQPLGYDSFPSAMGGMEIAGLLRIAVIYSNTSRDSTGDTKGCCDGWMLVSFAIELRAASSAIDLKKCWLLN